MGQQLTNKVSTQISNLAAAAGSADITDGFVIDTAGYEGCRFIVQFGTITAGAATSLKVQQAAVKATSTSLTSGADLLGSGVTVGDADDNKLFIIDVYRPRERYLQLHLLRATQNAVLNFAIAELYNARVLPVVQHADVDSQELHVSPAEGTA